MVTNMMQSNLSYFIILILVVIAPIVLTFILRQRYPAILLS